jgi:H+/Cl- antiporter ClcA
MKKIALFASGFITGLIIVFALFYALGHGLECLDIQLYKSESDQQRNFNIYIVTSVIVGLLLGYLFSRWFTPQSSSKENA